MSLDFIGFSLVTVVSFVFEKSYPVINGRTKNTFKVSANSVFPETEALFSMPLRSAL